MPSMTLYKNCTIHTLDEHCSTATAMLIKDGQIMAIGKEEEVVETALNIDKQHQENPLVDIVDLNGKTVLPAFCDSHLHAPGLAYDILFNINLYPALSQEETMEIIEDFIKEHPEKEMYYGRGFVVSLFEGEEGIIGPRKERLDEICPDKPIIISDFGGNCMWMNSIAMKKYDITPERKCPPGGEIQLTKEGELWGIIRNEARGFVPYQEFTEEENYRAMKFFQDKMHSLGYTSVFALRPPGTVEPRTTLFDAFKVLEEKGELKLRIHGARDIDARGDIDSQIEEILETKDRVKSELMDLTTAKFFLDGVVEGLDGYLMEPYEEAAGKGNNFTGELFWDKQKLAIAFEKCMKAGLQIHCHSIGDGTTRDALDALEVSLKKVPRADYRNILTHLQLVSEEDKKRMKEMNVVANVQPFWHFKSPVMFELETSLLGDRAEQEYPLGSLAKEGITIVASSDYPVTPEPNPFQAIEAGVTRNLINAEALNVEDIKDMDDPKYLLNREERMSIIEMLKAFSINAAYARFEEESRGSLEPGKVADFIVIDRDPFDINPVDIEKTKVLCTYFNGECVYKLEQ